MTDPQAARETPQNFQFRRDEDGRPLWHAPLPNIDFDSAKPYGPDNRPFSTCQVCSEPWPCVEAAYDAGPIVITGISLVSRGDGRDLVVLAEIDGKWRRVIETRYEPDGLLGYTVEPLGMRHAVVDRLATREAE